VVRGALLRLEAKVEANAAVDSLAPRWAVEAHLGELFDGEGQEEGEDPTATEASTMVAALPTAEDAALRERSATKSDWISRAGRQERSFKSGYRPRTSATLGRQRPILRPPR
jgi:hypothetical protein